MADLAVLSRDELARLLADAAAEGARRVLAERVAADELIDVTEVARRLGVSVRQVRSYVASGQLDAVRLPSTAPSTRKRTLVRVRSSDLADFVEKCQASDADPDHIVNLAVERAARRATRRAAV